MSKSVLAAALVLKLIGEVDGSVNADARGASG